MQLNLSFNSVHNYENNPASQAVLNERREDFNEQCWLCLKRMLKGERLSYLTAINTGIGDIRRRSKDLIDHKGIPVKREWAYVDGKRQDFKEYYIDQKDIPEVTAKILGQLVIIK